MKFQEEINGHDDNHNMGVIAEMADDVVVMYLGKIVESGSVYDIFYNPSIPILRHY